MKPRAASLLLAGCATGAAVAGVLLWQARGPAATTADAAAPAVACDTCTARQKAKQRLRDHLGRTDAPTE